jgi:cell wall-associated NlpC family hydrolase
VVGAAAVAVACLTVAPGAASAAPVNPSDQQLGAAQQAQQDAAAQVGQVTAALATAQSAADSAAAAANIALQDYEEKQSAADAAHAAADVAAAAAAKADADLGEGRAAVVAFARDSYKQGSTSSGARALMTSGGPAELLERAALLDAAGEHKVDVVAQLTVLEQQATQADQAAQQTVVQAETLKTEAATLLVDAQAQESQARSQADSLAQQQEQYEAGLATAQQTLVALQGQRAAAETYAAEQAAAATKRAAAAAAAASSSQSSSSHSSSSSSSSSGSSSSGSSSSGSSSSGSSSNTGGSSSKLTATAPRVVTTTADAPSGSAVDRAIAAAKSQLGVAYSWGGGGSSGPSYGISPDTGVYGFDCSGLTQYAYARAGVSIAGTSREQYNQFRNRTVAVDDLQPGDLLFWDDGSSNPTYQDIVHVALYLGGNQMIEAPDRGLSVMTSRARTTSRTYFGAVRPTG